MHIRGMRLIDLISVPLQTCRSVLDLKLCPCKWNKVMFCISKLYRILLALYLKARHLLHPFVTFFWKRELFAISCIPPGWLDFQKMLRFEVLTKYSSGIVMFLAIKNRNLFALARFLKIK